MILKAAALLVFIIFFAFLSLASFVSAIIGFIKARKKLWVTGLVVCLFSTCLFSLTTIYAGKKAVNKTYQTGVKTVDKAHTTARTFLEQVTDGLEEFIAPGPEIRFTRSTGFEWPESAEIIADYYEDFLFDWTSYLVFEADHEVLKAWLSSPPPWDVEEWTRGPVPSKMLKTSFGTEGGQRLLESDRIWYAAKEYCCSDRGSDLEFHSGALFIIDPDLNKVWFAAWDH